jgi:tetratricopeptide (TPR) repeat protein
MSYRNSTAFSARPAFFAITCLAGLIAFSETAYAQFTTATPTQSDLMKLPNGAQGARLADVVRQTAPNRKCSQAKASLEKALDSGVGGWLVQCEEGQDYWVVVPAEPKKAAIAVPCVLARATAQTDCYANFRTVLPEHPAQCTQSPFPDRVISACTAIIQSAKAADKPAALSIAYQSRGVAFTRYQQLDLALSDLDRAVKLNPSDAYALYNRAVTLERKGDFDQAIRDLDETLRLKPDHPYANYERGFAYLKKGGYDRAIDDFNQAIRLNPGDAKAYRNRAAAYKGKGEPAKAEADLQKATELDPNVRGQTISPPSPPPSPAPSQTSNGLSDAEKQAAYCMEASFGYTGQYTRLIGVLRDNVKTMEAMRGRPDLPANGTDQIAAALKTINERIAASEAKKAHWNELTMVFLNYLKNHKLLEEKTQLVASVSTEVRKDQQAVSDTYSACLRLCKPDDPSCKNACDSKANASAPSKRMLRCEQVAADFK